MCCMKCLVRSRTLHYSAHVFARRPEVPSSEPARVRAFSVGSRVSLKLLSGLTRQSSPSGGGAASPNFHNGASSSTASSTSSTPISGAARFLAGLSNKGITENNYIRGCGSHSPYFLMNLGGAVSPSSSCSSSSSFNSPYTEFCSPITPIQGRGRTVKPKSTR